MKRLLTIFTLLTCCLMLYAEQTASEDTIKRALAKIDEQIAFEQQMGDSENEGYARWQKMVALKNFSMTKQEIDEATIQMEWFSQHSQWNNFYRTWQIKANALSALGKLQLALQETQQMLNDAKKRDNKLGRAMAYKQIGVIYLNMKQTEPAVEALQHYAELMKDETDDFNSLSNIYYRMAKAYDYAKAYDKELGVTNEWLSYLHHKVGEIKRPDVRECYNSCYLARAAAFIGQKKFEEAKEALDTASHHAHLIKTSLSLHHYYKMEARYNLALGNAAKALLYTDSVRIITNEKDDHSDEVRAQALMMLGRGTEAAEIFHRLYHERDSVFGLEARQHLDELNTLFQVDELKTEQQKAKLRYTMLATISIVLILLLLGFFGWFYAIRQKKANEQLRIANEKVASSSKMKLEFIKNISHEIRTPLNVVSGFTQILTAEGMEVSESDKKEYRERITENTDRITRMVDRLLLLSDLNSDTLIGGDDQTSVHEIVTQAIEFSGIKHHTRPDNADSAVIFENHEPSTQIPVRTNIRHAFRSLAQLLENAVKFTKEGSIRLFVEDTDTMVRFIVEDTGIGVPASEAEHIFDEFVQLDTFADGAGVGLTVCRSINRRMGGNVWLDTKYSQGARFVLEIKKGIDA